MRTAEIKGIGAYAPERILGNEELSKTIDTSDEWIHSHTGIKNRHIASSDEAASDLGVKAARIAMERARVDVKDLDFIITATASGDFSGFPATACVIQDALGARNAAAFDLLAGCTGFVYSLSVARDMIIGGGYRHILVIGTEVLSRITNWKDRDTCVLFGDGAGAAVVSANDGQDGRGILHSILRVEGAGGEHLMRKAGGSRYPFAHNVLPPYEDICISMNGRKVYGFAVRANTILISALLKKADIPLDDVKYIVPHQANERIIQAAADRLQIPIERFYMNMAEYANTSSASIPIALNEMTEKGLLEKGDLIMTLGFGSGLTYGGCLIRW